MSEKEEGESTPPAEISTTVEFLNVVAVQEEFRASEGHTTREQVVIVKVEKEQGE